MLLLRIIIDILIFLGVFIFPSWIFVILGLFGVFYFYRFYEILALGLLIDSLYNTQDHLGGFFYTVAAIVIFLLSFEVKKRLKFYEFT